MTSSRMVVAVCLLYLGIGDSQAQTTPYLEDLLKSIFTPQPPAFQPPPTSTPDFQSNPQPQPQPQQQPNPNQASLPDSGRGKVCGGNQGCVARFLCNDDDVVETDGDVCAFLEVCCNTGNKLTEPKEPIKPVDSHEGCGYRNPEGVGSSITGDKEDVAQFGEFPWMVAILRDEVVRGETLYFYECGGSVIAPNVVLTAAHCVRNLAPYVLVVRAGEWDSRTKEEVLPHQDARVKEILPHEKFNKYSHNNDVALLILETTFNWEDNVRPICLPEENSNFDFARCYATGWGKDKSGKDGNYQLILKKIDLPVVPRDTCQTNLRRTRLTSYFILDRSFMCAGGERGKDTCKGDGGSPLVCPDPQNPKRYYQAGIVSWGVRCGIENIPGVYANVPYLRNWINEKLSTLGIDFKYFTAS